MAIIVNEQTPNRYPYILLVFPKNMTHTTYPTKNRLEWQLDGLEWNRHITGIEVI